MHAELKTKNLSLISTKYILNQIETKEFVVIGSANLPYLPSFQPMTIMLVKLYSL